MLRQISFETKPIVFGIKSPTVWVGSRKNPGAIYPICYMRKPKHVNQEEFDAFIKALTLSVTKEFLNRPVKDSLTTGGNNGMDS